MGAFCPQSLPPPQAPSPKPAGTSLVHLTLPSLSSCVWPVYTFSLFSLQRTCHSPSFCIPVLFLGCDFIPSHLCCWKRRLLDQPPGTLNWPPRLLSAPGGRPAPQLVTEAPLSPGPLAGFIFFSRPEEHQDKLRKLEHERGWGVVPCGLVSGGLYELRSEYHTIACSVYPKKTFSLFLNFELGLPSYLLAFSLFRCLPLLCYCITLPQRVILCGWQTATFPFLVSWFGSTLRDEYILCRGSTAVISLVYLFIFFGDTRWWPFLCLILEPHGHRGHKNKFQFRAEISGTLYPFF